VSPGDEAAVIDKNGHKIVKIQRHKYYEHQLIWIYHGNDPVVDLERIDGDRLNNSIKNLRRRQEKTIEELKSLSDPHRTNKCNTSGFRGVYPEGKNKWRGLVTHRKNRYNVGLFTDKHECAEAVKDLRTKLQTGLTKP